MPLRQMKESSEQHLVIKPHLPNTMNQAKKVTKAVQNGKGPPLLSQEQRNQTSPPPQGKSGGGRRSRNGRKSDQVDVLMRPSCRPCTAVKSNENGHVVQNRNVVSSDVEMSFPTSSKSLTFAQRPGYGQVGTKCIVKVNHFFAELPDKDLNQYDVTITPEVSSKAVNRSIIAELVRLYKESDLGTRLPAYDGRKSLYTAGVLPFSWREFTIKLIEEEDGINGPKREKEYKVVINIAAISDDSFFSPETEYQPLQASQFLNQYIAAIADELKGSPLVVSVLDGSTLRLLFEDEDDFAMLAENPFTELNVEDKGKIIKSEIRNALVQMGVDMGVPPFSEYPQLNDLLSKHGADGEEELGQEQFAQLLQFVLQDLEVELSKKNFVFVQNIPIINGSKIRQLLANEKELNSFIEKASQEKLNAKDGLGSTEIIRSFLEKNTTELGLPLYDGGDAADLFMIVFFADVAKEKGAVELEKEEPAKLLKDVLEKMAEQLELNPVYQDFA
ncbi:unnamed protein product [Vicia faba]|uniref:Protein argonaute N-terminal domain-containing protein n=1 Tax=Vicia faba TaxID=3906 RepID=A0AAV1AX89_VICFA|nr:unnamed protein product [Vicia faba]